MTTIAEVINIKGSRVWSIRPDATVFDAIKLMADKCIGGLVVKERNRLVGIITERDYTRKVILKGQSSKQTLVRDIMTTGVITVAPERTVEECMGLMMEKSVRHLPVMDGERLVGIVSMRDMVQSTISEQQFIIDRLEHFAEISGTVHKWVAKMEDESLKLHDN